MPIEISWFDEEKTILFGKFTDAWTWADYAQSFIQTIELAQGIQYRLDQIIDMSESALVPAGQALPHIKRSREYSKPLDIHLTVLVGASPVFRGLLSTAAITTSQKSRRLFTDNFEDAHALIRADRQKSNNAGSSN
jgi:hypothetical protein